MEEKIEKKMKNEIDQVYLKRDRFFLLKNPTVKKLHKILRWANSCALFSQVTFLDCTQSFRRLHSDKKIEDLLPFITQKNKTCFKVILRRDFNWYGWFSDDTHIEDIIEVAMWGIEIDSKEYFIQCFLKKEYMPQLNKKFDLVEIK